MNKLWLVLALLGLGVNFWLLKTVGGEWRENVKLEKETRQLRVKADDRNRLVQEQQLLAPHFQELDNFFVVGETGVAQVAAALEALGRQTGVAISLAFEDFPKKIDIGGSYQSALKIQVEAIGSYQDVVSWLRGVEQLPYLIRFEEVKLGLPRENVGIKAELNGAIFLKN